MPPSGDRVHTGDAIVAIGRHDSNMTTINFLISYPIKPETKIVAIARGATYLIRK